MWIPPGMVLVECFARKLLPSCTSMGEKDLLASSVCALVEG